MVNNKILYDSCKTFNIDASSVQSLIESGANPLYEYDGETPLKAYVTKKNNNIKNDVVILLLSSVDYKNINDFDIFEYLCSDNIDINLLKLLISKGIEINSIKNGINIVEKYATTSNPNVDVFKLLLDRYANNPELREYYELKQNKIYVEAYDIISNAIVKHDRIHKTIESVDDNTYISNLPYTIKYKIFEQQ
ncbi:truncated ankyrin-like protein [Vaccinia virus]|nr:truncated ankyrin-like protein [Vaccinia virus]QQA05281.1 truncated ankyrin-like protein [Vaccinia virus]QQA05501.1 truncated ankyrin-repeat protein [Vaccinia virus]